VLVVSAANAIVCSGNNSIEPLKAIAAAVALFVLKLGKADCLKDAVHSLLLSSSSNASSSRPVSLRAEFYTNLYSKHYIVVIPNKQTYLFLTHLS
jgi:hypothetical protein